MPTPTAKKAAEPKIAPELQLFKTDPKPALLLWLLVTTNPAFIPQLKKAKTSNAVSARLGISPSYVQKFLAAVQADQPNFQAIQGIFQELSHDAGYDPGPPCPSSIEEVLGL